MKNLTKRESDFLDAMKGEGMSDTGASPFDPEFCALPPGCLGYEQQEKEIERIVRKSGLRPSHPQAGKETRP